MITTCVVGFLIIEGIIALLWVFSPSRNVRKICSWLARPLLFVCYIAAICCFCIKHSDESFINNILSKETSFSTAMRELTDEPLWIMNIKEEEE